MRGYIHEDGMESGVHRKMHKKGSHAGCGLARPRRGGGEPRGRAPQSHPAQTDARLVTARHPRRVPSRCLCRGSPGTSSPATCVTRPGARAEAMRNRRRPRRGGGEPRGRAPQSHPAQSGARLATSGRSRHISSRCLGRGSPGTSSPATCVTPPGAPKRCAMLCDHRPRARTGGVSRAGRDLTALHPRRKRARADNTQRHTSYR